MSVISEKKKLIIDHIKKTMDLIDPSGYNSKMYVERLTKYSDKEFDYFMSCLRDEKEILYMDTPNLKVTLQFENIQKAAEYLGISFFHRLRMKDPLTGIEYVTNQKAMIVEECVRRMQQTLFEKLSIPINDKKIDGLTGQVTGDDRACAITYPEIQALKAQGFKDTLTEIVVARGGNLSAYAKMKQDLEDIGEADINNAIDPNSIARSAVVLDVMLMSMGYETNITERG